MVSDSPQPSTQRPAVGRCWKIKYSKPRPWQNLAHQQLPHWSLRSSPKRYHSRTDPYSTQRMLQPRYKPRQEGGLGEKEYRTTWSTSHNTPRRYTRRQKVGGGTAAKKVLEHSMPEAMWRHTVWAGCTAQQFFILKAEILPF
jgi:hypothetical protein